jgi:hypothetical protein
MNDLIYLAVTLAFFLSGSWFVDGCERLRGLK